MPDTLKEIKDAWLEDETILAEFYIHELDAHVVLFRHDTNNDPVKPSYSYGLIRFFKLGAGWAASNDMVGGGTEAGLLACVRALAKLMIAEPPAQSRFVGTEDDIVFDSKDPKPGEEVNNGR
jgi:hypothetical protein